MTASSPIAQTIARAEARAVYNQLGSGLDRAARFESHAKALALQQLRLLPGQRVLQVGVGTGGEQQALAAAVGPTGTAVGLDLARTMLALTRVRAATPLVEADALRLPFASQSFDRLLCAYVLDLLPAAELPAALLELRRVLRPAGRLVLVSMTEGVSLASRLFVAGWKLGFRADPARFGGCRPLEIAPLLANSDLRLERHVVVQRGFPSEVLVVQS